MWHRHTHSLTHTDFPGTLRVINSILFRILQTSSCVIALTICLNSLLPTGTVKRKVLVLE